MDSLQTELKIKVCCISALEEAKQAIDAGADYLGLVGPMPSGPGVLSLEELEKIAKHLGEEVHLFLLSSETDPEKIALDARRVGVQSVQLVRHLSVQQRERLKKLLPHTGIVQVLHVQGAESLSLAQHLAVGSDMLLLDSGAPADEKLGGTGKTHNWELSRQIVQQVQIPVILAGGLKAENVAQAVQTVKPYGVDVCSGLRTRDILDIAKLQQFVDQVRKRN